MKPSVLRICAAVALLNVTLPIAAHHSAVMFDMEREITLEATVIRFDWANPHIYIEIETGDDSAEAEVWTIEGSSASLARRIGWTPESFRPGDRVTVVAHPGRDEGKRFIRGVSLTKQDGVLLAIPNLGSVQALTPERSTHTVATGISGTWVSDPSSPRSRYPETWPLTSEGRAALEGYDESLNPFNDCVPLAAPWLMVSSGFIKSIEIGDDAIVIRAAEAVRTVHMDADSHDGAALSVQGHSIGRWEDGALVVETSRFADHPFGYGRGLASGTQKRLVERLALNPDGTRLLYSFEVEDPEYLTEPVSGTFDLVYRPDLPNFDEHCDPETARRFLAH